MNLTVIQLVTIICILVFQVSMIIIYAVLLKYGANADPVRSGESEFSAHGYGMFQDVHVMVFIGFGFLMAFLKKYAYSAIGFSIVISASVVEWSIFLEEMIYEPGSSISVSMKSVFEGDVAAAVFLISFGAILGKVNVLQLFIMALSETAAFIGNKYVLEKTLKVSDPGGSMVVHAFGAYFGVCVSFVLSFRTENPTGNHPEEGASQQSDTFAMIGTLFLWVFWPSFNSGTLSSLDHTRSIINTYLSLVASCVCAFAVSSAVRKDGKFEMAHIQNATLAGGVSVGAVCSLDIKPVGALTIGSVAGTASVLGYRYIQGFVHKKLRSHDTCGVHNLHGIPGVIGGLASMIMAFIASEKTYGSRLLEIYPAMNPFQDNRSAVMQGVFQLIGLLTTLGIALVSGLITGILIAFPFPKMEEGEKFVDRTAWKDPETNSE